MAWQRVALKKYEVFEEEEESQLLALTLGSIPPSSSSSSSSSQSKAASFWSQWESLSRSGALLVVELAGFTSGLRLKSDASKL